MINDFQTQSLTSQLHSRTQSRAQSSLSVDYPYKTHSFDSSLGPMSKSTQVSPSLTKGNSIEGTDSTTFITDGVFPPLFIGNALDYLHLDDPKLSGVMKSVKATPKSMGSVIQRNRRSCETAYSPMIRRKDLPKLSADLGKDKKNR